MTGLDLGSVATYMCNPGYTPVGNLTRDCVQVENTTADWSDKAPVCTRTSKMWSIHIFEQHFMCVCNALDERI